MKNIVLASDNNFVQHCAVTMVSVLKNNIEVHFYLISEGLTSYNMDILNDLVKNWNGKLTFIKIEKKLLEKFPMPNLKGLEHISIATYYRLFVSSLLPQTLDRVLYLDCDIVVRSNLSELFDMEIDNKALAAVYQDDPIMFDEDNYKRLNIPPSFGYFNAGVLLINLEYWRKNSIEDKLLKFVEGSFLSIKMHDQDVLNAVLYSETKMLECKWNMLTIFFTRVIFEFTSKRCIYYRNTILHTHYAAPSIVHFVSKPKPWEWECSHPYKKDYYYYLSFTPWKGWIPQKIFTVYALKEKIKNIFPFKLLPIFKKSGIFIK